ncbi:hypothetical protein CMV_022670 [Castanea mollissima]|uniref:Uncharacterized protein n=1 Tax=Castanea mollissima TaxID=60419 RepID=A0A8J4QQM7_9ROSI|nr:hypothetical protein CMV_022670 [Castanea mollissima]
MRKQIQTSVMILPMNLYKVKKTMPQADRADTCYLMFKEQLSRQKQKATYESPSIVYMSIFLKGFIEVADGNEAFEYEGYALAGGLFLAKCLKPFSERQWFFQTRIIGSNQIAT